MKQFKIFMTAFVLVFILTACTQASVAPAPDAPTPSAQEQIDALIEQKELWLVTDSAFEPFYALTDVNEDGLLELMRCEPGDDWSSTDAFFAVAKDGKTVRELAFPYGEGHSHPDLVSYDAYRLYVGEDARYLVTLDDIYLGPTQASDYRGRHAVGYLSLGEDSVEADDITFCDMLDEDTNGDGLSEYHMYYRTPDGASLDPQGYRAAAAERFAGCQQRVCGLQWWTPDPDRATDDDALKEGLLASWEGFSLTEDDALFESLIMDPYLDFYAAGAGGPTIYFEGDEVPAFPSFLDIWGTWYLQYAWTDEGTWYVGKELAAGELNILGNGQLYANYYNEADPRGAYLFTEMSMTQDTRALGTDKDDWCITYESADGIWRMDLRPDLDNDMLYVTWYEWEDASRMTEPIGMNLVYSRAAG